MATNGFLAKEKLTAICDSIRAKTGSTGLIPIDDIPQAITNIQTGGGIIEADELPTEGVEGSIYKIKPKIKDGLAIIERETKVEVLYTSKNFTLIGIEEVETKPTENIVESNINTLSIYLYYVKSENDIFISANLGAGSTWYNLGTIFQLMGTSGLTFKGEVNYLSEVYPIQGYYAYYDDNIYFIYKNGKFSKLEIENRSIQKVAEREFIEKIEIENYIPCDLYVYNNSFTLNTNYLKITTNFWHLYSDEIKKFTIGENAFVSCLAKTIYIKNNVECSLNCDVRAFNYCSNLTKLVLDFKDFTSDITGTNAYIVENTPINDGNGYIYVPDNLVDKVKTLNGFSLLSSQIKPLSEYVEE